MFIINNASNEKLVINTWDSELKIAIWDGNVEDNDEIAVYVNNQLIKEKIILKEILTSLNNDFGSNYLTDVTQRIASRFEGVNTLRVGGEYRIKDISFRAGFLNQYTVHSNTIKNNKALTFGIGLDFGASSLGISLVNYEQNKEFELFSEGLTDPYFLRQKITQLTISYNFKL